MVYVKQGKYEKALELYNKALDIYKSTLGENHVYVANSCFIIATILKDTGKFADSLQYLYKALEILMLNPEQNKNNIVLIKVLIAQIQQLINSNDSN